MGAVVEAPGKRDVGDRARLVLGIAQVAHASLQPALQDELGQRDFLVGKGLVQMPIDLSDGAELRLTIARYFTPSGRSIQKPYDEGYEAYERDELNRFEQGEYFSADSIKFNDSLKYQTT